MQLFGLVSLGLVVMEAGSENSPSPPAQHVLETGQDVRVEWLWEMAEC